MSEGYDIVLWPLLAIATFSDLLYGKIWNVLTLPLIAVAPLVRFYLGGIEEATIALIAVTVAFAIFFPLYFIKTLAAGDVKLLMALGAWSSYLLVLKIGFLTVLVGATVGAFLLIKKKGLMGATQSVADHAKEVAKDKKDSFRMPFGPAFLCSFFLIKIFDLKGWSF